MHYTCDHQPNTSTHSGGTPHTSGGTTPRASGETPGGTTPHANLGSVPPGNPSGSLPGPYQPAVVTAPVSGAPFVHAPPSATGTYVPGPQPGTYFQGSTAPTGGNPQAGMAQQRAQFFDSSPGAVTFSPAPPTYHAYVGAPGIQVPETSTATESEYFFDAIESSSHLLDEPLVDSGCTPTTTLALEDLTAPSIPTDGEVDGWDFPDPWLDGDDLAASYFGWGSKGYGG